MTAGMKVEMLMIVIDEEGAEEGSQNRDTEEIRRYQ